MGSRGTSSYSLLSVIAEHGLGSKILMTAKEYGVTGGTILLGRGTIHNRLLEFLGINDIRKEIVLMLADAAATDQALEGIKARFQLEKPNHGIAFTVPVANLFGLHANEDSNTVADGGEKKNMYNAIFTIVDKGGAETVLDTAAAAGAKGGTVINARGSGVHEESRLFSMVVEPEKEIVLILSGAEQTDAIVAAIRDGMEIEKPGKGIMFVLGVDKAIGLYEG